MAAPADSTRVLVCLVGVFLDVHNCKHPLSVGKLIGADDVHDVHAEPKFVWDSVFAYSAHSYIQPAACTAGMYSVIELPYLDFLQHFCGEDSKGDTVTPEFFIGHHITDYVCPSLF